MEKDLGDRVAFVSEVLHVVFYAEVIEAIDLTCIGWNGVSSFTIFLNDGIAFLVEFGGDVARGFDDEIVFRVGEASHQGHEGGLATTYGSIE